MKKVLGIFLLISPLLLVLSVCIMVVGIVDGLFVFIMGILLTAIFTLCVAKGIDLLDNK
jgi:hypothetical protein